MSVIMINQENFRTEVLESQKTILLDFWASWCGPCRMVLPLLDEIAQERTDVKVCKINVDEEPELAARYDISTIPTLMVLRGGEVVKQKVGAMPKAQLLAMLD